MRARFFIVATSVVIALGGGAWAAQPAAASVTGAEKLSAVLVKIDPAGTRQLVISHVVARGVFDGVGRIVERDNLPTDPDNVNRDDLIFSEGILHIFNENLDVSFSVNDRSCTFEVFVQQITHVDGGTGLFANAAGSFNSTVRAVGVAARNPDRSCDLETQEPVLEVDLVAASGSLTLAQ
jgi:hypothetical protein